MHAEDYQASVRKRLMPTLVPRVIADAVDSSKGVEVEGHNLALELLGGQRR